MKTIWAAFCGIGCAGFLASCGTTVMGSQTIAFNVIPETAQCDAFEHSEKVASYDPSQRSLTVPKSMGSLDIVCTAPGFKDKRINLIPDNSAAGRIGGAFIDYGPLTGSYGYPATLQITMENAGRQGAPL